MKTALLLSTAFITTTPQFSNREERIQQYLFGIDQIAQFVQKHQDVFDVFCVDNTVEDYAQLDQRLKAAIEAIPNLKKTDFFFDNDLGKKNKGAGVIIQWKHILPQIESTYEYVIHFEPRQKLDNFSFFDRYINKENTYLRTEVVTGKKFKIFPIRWKQTMTGLFSIKKEDLQMYATQVSLQTLVFTRTSVEKDLYQYIVKNKIPHIEIESMGVLWHNTADNTYLKL